MASPRDNTEVLRILKDFKNAVYTKFSPNFTGVYGSTVKRANRRVDSSDVAMKLNFSNLNETTKLAFSSPSPSKSKNSCETPDVLKRKLATTELELQASKAALVEKETAISMMEPANKKVCLSLEQKLANCQKQNEIDQETILRLRNQLKFTENEAVFARSMTAECERAKKFECDKLEMKILSLNQECGDLKVEISRIKSENTENIRKLNRKLGRLQWNFESVSNELTHSKVQNQSLIKQVQELTEKASKSTDIEKELQSAHAKIKSMEDQIEAEKDASLIVKAKECDLKLLSDLQEENKQLREELSNYKDNNVALFQEKMWAFQEKAAEMDKKNATIAKLEVENEKLTKRIIEWESLFDDKESPSSRSPSSFLRRVSHYQKNEVILSNKISKLTVHCETLEKQKEALENALEQIKKKYEQMKESAGNYDPIVKRLRQRIVLLSKERDSCRKLIDSYVSENTFSGAAINSTHFKHLENTIAEYEKSLEKADQEVEELESKVKNLTEKVKILDQTEEAVRELRESKIELLEKLEKIENEKSQLENRLSDKNKGMYPGQKIIHLRCNPIDDAVKMRAAELGSLREENDKLRKRVQVLEEEGSSASNVTMKVEEKLEKEGSDTMLQTLKEQLTTAERQNKMILDAARSKSREFREAIYSLTGYKVDSPLSGHYKLSHVYSDSPEEHLLFELNSSGVHLLETEFSNHLTEQIEMYLHAYDSVPAFLASVTLDLFKQQTYMARTSLVSIE